MSILDKVAIRPSSVSFRPETARQLFVLRLAQKLGEPKAVEHYLEVASEHSDECLLQAYRKVTHRGCGPAALARQFHEELKSARPRDDRNQTDRLLAIKVERRSIAVAVFFGSVLDFHDVRHLSSNDDKADTSAVGFLNWVLSNFDVESVALEQMTNGGNIRRVTLNQAVLTALRASYLPVWEVRKQDLLEGYGVPPLRSRGELRQTVHTMLWSMFNTDSPGAQELDASAVGLYVQTERMFLYE